MNELDAENTRGNDKRYGVALAAILIIIALFVGAVLVLNVAHSAPHSAPASTHAAHIAPACTHVQALTHGLLSEPRAAYVDVCADYLPGAPDYLNGANDCDYVRLDVQEPAVQLQCLYTPSGSHGQFLNVNGARVWTFTECLYYGDKWGTGNDCSLWTPNGPIDSAN